MTGLPFHARPRLAPPARPAGRRRSPLIHGPVLFRAVSFAAVGLACTVAFALLFTLLRRFLVPLEANLVAMSATMGLNFAANRRFTFRAQSGSVAGHAAGYVAVYLLGLGASSGVLHVSLLLLHPPAGAGETLLALASGIVATVVRFVLLSIWVFRAPAGEEVSGRAG